MLNPRKDTFDEYRENHRQQRVDFIKRALVVLSNAKYVNVTRLARDVSKLVTEFEAKVHANKSESERDELCKPVSHVTLLRNISYRKILEDFMAVEARSGTLPGSVITDIEALRIRNASLESQNLLLKEKIRSVDLGVRQLDSSKREMSDDEFESLRKGVLTLIKIIDGMVGQASDIYITVLEGEESSEYPEAGFYGPWEKISTIDELRELERMRKRLHKESALN
ncbi:hypothetical protein [Pseudomonas sp. ICMP 561]|uniref:hypothetical protein n=1 Tax=Pseudomonas sp. ICMP 561 TaxID=1718918 RepID=UPI000C08C288|nr:hypothetical protein [Pseudomonas sp. ICMP 561]PHN17221.1 hypothetical protein AO242_21250 [Pseudomonas sp. ICMP 561]